MLLFKSVVTIFKLILKMRRVFSILIMFILGVSTYAQERRVEFGLSNDIMDFQSQSYRYFSNGVNLKFSSDLLKKSPVALILPYSKRSDAVSYIEIVQEMYTGDKLNSPVILEWDRPFASSLSLKQGSIYANSESKFKLESNFEIGFLGEYSGGQYIQNFIHSLTPHSDSVKAWSNQIGHDLIVQYNLDYEKAYYSSNNINVYSHLDLDLGSKVTQAFIGNGIEFGIFEDNYSNSLDILSSYWGIMIYAEGLVGYQIYNATLEGGIFLKDQNNHIVQRNEIQKVRYRLEYGLRASNKNFELEYGWIWNNREFVGAYDHAFGFMRFKLLF